MYARVGPGQGIALRSLDSARGYASESSSSTPSRAVGAGRSSAWLAAARRDARRPPAARVRGGRSVGGPRRRRSPGRPVVRRAPARRRPAVRRRRPRGPRLRVDPARDRQPTGGRSSPRPGRRRAARSTNNRYSADVVAIACAEVLAGLPDLPSDNALPRWLAEVAGYPVEELTAAGGSASTSTTRSTWSCSAGRGPRRRSASRPASTRPAPKPPWEPCAAVARDASAELLVAGRASSASLAWLERRTAARIRALIEERGLRAASPAAASSAAARPRPPASVLGVLLDRDGPESFGSWHRPAGRRRPRRQPGAARSPARRRRAGLAGRRGSLRLRPPARTSGSPIRGCGR